MKRATLVKMKNGRHRVATDVEITQIKKANDALMEANHQRDRAFSAISRLNQAKEEAANEILKKEFLPIAVNQVVESLSHRYGPELMKHAQQLKNSDRRREPWLYLSASFDPMEMKVMRIRGEIPALRYEIAVMG